MFKFLPLWAIDELPKKINQGAFMEQTSIKNIMTREVQCVSPKTPLSHVIEAMRENCHSCMIITEDEIPVGVITERDMVRHFSDLLRKRSGLRPRRGIDHVNQVGNVA
jgi:CBS domain-containing protein